MSAAPVDEGAVTLLLDSGELVEMEAETFGQLQQMFGSRS